MAEKKSAAQQNKDALESGGRIPPQAIEIEEAVLGAILIEQEAKDIALQMLKKEDFYNHAHQHIFESILGLSERDNPIDLLTLENDLRDKKLLEVVGGVGYLSSLTRSVSSAANLEYHIQIIKEKAIKRNLILDCTDIIKLAYDSAEDTYDLLDNAEAKIFNIANQKNQAATVQVGSIMQDTITYFENMMDKKSAITGLTSGLDVDQLTSGWQPGDLIIIAARPSMGKTAFVLTAARNAALNINEEEQKAIAIFSLEMSKQSLTQRLVSMEGRINLQKARSGRLSQEEFKYLIDAASRLFNAPIYIDDTPGLSIMELRTKCRRLKSDKDIGLVIVDYLQLMTASGKNFGSREQEIASISRGLKALAKELDVPVIALSQLSRAVEQRSGDKRPQLSDLRESGSIEQDADVVMFLYRPEYYGIKTTAEGQSTAGLAEVIVGKQRNGPTGSKALYFVKDYARFENLSTTTVSDPFHQGYANEEASLESGGNDGPPPLPHNPTGGEDSSAPF